MRQQRETKWTIVDTRRPRTQNRSQKEEPDMFMVPIKPASLRPAAVWSGFPPRLRTRRTTVHPKGCRLYRRRPESRPRPGALSGKSCAPGPAQPSRLDVATVSRWSESTLRRLNTRQGVRPWRRSTVPIECDHRFPGEPGPTLLGLDARHGFRPLEAGQRNRPWMRFF